MFKESATSVEADFSKAGDRLKKHPIPYENLNMFKSA